MRQAVKFDNLQIFVHCINVCISVVYIEQMPNSSYPGVGLVKPGFVLLSDGLTNIIGWLVHLN